MTDLYIRLGTDPQALPFADHDETGRLWTDLANSEEGREATGWSALAPALPDYNPETQAPPRWDDGAWVVDDLPPPPEPDMPALRAQALATAIAYGNRLTQGEVSQWAGVEPFSWPQQREEAKIVRSGGTLGEDAILPGLAEDKGVSLADYADDVWANAMRYQAVLRGAVYLRRAATNTLTDEALDTPEKLTVAVAALTIEADALAAQLLGG
jgi:hypothetical protein